MLTRSIGAAYEYSNLGMGLLGHLLSLQAKVDYATLVSRTIQPLQMIDTQIHLTAEQQARFATGHDALGNPVSSWDLPTLAGAGGLRSTATDLLKFLAANLDQELAPSSITVPLHNTHTIQIQTGSPEVAMALGWHVLTQNQTEIILHNGGTGGFRSFIGFVKQPRLGVVVLSNSEHEISDIGLHLLDRQHPLTQYQPPKQRVAIALDPTVLDAYVGQYELAPNFILTITKDQGRLYAQATGQAKLELFAETATQFFITDVDAQITFLHDSQGEVTRLVLHQSGQELPANKLT
ncbi:MAG: serine hydrolase [Leptolyngbyaceae cyanobacterium SL_7_1]|nr:serine hydrolase [Leptolyngbyaceae cyanobacterium SL_7_1]